MTKEEGKSGSVEEERLPDWGRVLIAGGTDWPTLGRKQSEKSLEHVDLPSPHILRDVAHERMKRGDLYTLGRNEHGQTGLPKDAKASGGGGTAIYASTRLDREHHFVPPLPSNKDGDVIHVACGRSHSVLCTRSGAVYATGLNKDGQCGNKQTQGDLEKFRRVDAAPFVKEKDAVVMCAAGLTFSLLCTASGKVYAMGSTEKGQLGNGRTGEHFVSGNKLAFNTHTEPLLVRALSDKKVVQISCGQQHSIALDDEGYCYVWGFGGYGRLGIGTQQDQLTPVLVPQFARDNILTRAAQVIAGPTNTVVIDRQRTYWLAGKWKNTGDGGAGQGYMTFKYLHELMGCKMYRASQGGVTLIAVAEEEKDSKGPQQATMNIAWGQSAGNGELGLGDDKPRSATKPVRCETLDGIAILDVACGQNSTFYIARNMGDAYSELPYHPAAPESQDHCLVCGKGEDTDEANALLECERCEEPWHLRCLNPPLTSVPEGEWHCPHCLDLVLDRSKLLTSTNKSAKKRGNSHQDGEDIKSTAKKAKSRN